MSVVINGIKAAELLRVFEWARIGANNCMIGYGVVVTELSDHGDLIDRDALKDKINEEWFSGYPADVFVGYIDIAPVVIPAERS